MVEDSSGKYVEHIILACKILFLSKLVMSNTSVKEAVNALLLESDIMTSLSRENIIKILNVFYLYDRFSRFSQPIHVLLFIEL